MENIRQAIERAKGGQRPQAVAQRRDEPEAPRRRAEFGPGPASRVDPRTREVELRGSYLQARRIISHMPTDRRAKAFDMLRTQVLQSMDLKGWKVLAVTSPTPACGKTLMSLNLALSIARQPERSVLLVDLDLQRPQVAKTLGLECAGGTLNVLQEQNTLSSEIVHARVGNQRFMVLPTAATAASSELMASRAMTALFQDLRRDFHDQTIILDLPPVLAGDDVIAVLPQVDCVLLVAAVGTSTIAEIEECNKHLQSVDVVRVVLNKAPETRTHYYY